MESHHKPIESIHLKHLHSAPARIRRMFLRLQPYDIVIRYRPGPDVNVADTLACHACMYIPRQPPAICRFSTRRSFDRHGKENGKKLFEKMK